MYAERICQSAITPQCPFVLFALLIDVRFVVRWKTGGFSSPLPSSPQTHGGIPTTYRKNSAVSAHARRTETPQIDLFLVGTYSDRT